MSVPYDVAIVGLGPTGATLANYCGMWGLRTVVFERSTAPYPQPRACHLDAEIARVFQHLGFEDELRGLLTVSAGMEYVDAVDTALVHFHDGAVTFWHSHPGGQQLYVVSGHARVGTEADGEVALQVGALVVCPADEPHWHGAMPNENTTLLAVTWGTTQWTERSPL